VTSLTRPVIVLEELFTSPVLDLSWGPRGLSCMACSGDGTTAYMEFTHQEIGTPITDTDKVLFSFYYLLHQSRLMME
jgi:protein HIRA/HIR1